MFEIFQGWEVKFFSGGGSIFFLGGGEYFLKFAFSYDKVLPCILQDGTNLKFKRLFKEDPVYVVIK